MKSLKKLMLFVLLVIAANSYSQMVPPDPIKSDLLEAMTGSWTADPYQMMGSTMNETVTQKMILNGQFMEVDVKSVGSNGFVYEAKGIFYPSPDGMWTGTMYDIFGKKGTVYNGKVDGNKINFTGVNDMMTETREIIVDGNTMTHNVTFDITGMPQQKLTVTFKKQ